MAPLRWALALALAPWLPAAGDVAAVSLQNAEGQHLHFLRLAISAAFFGPFAMVENEMVFENPEARTMEGRFSFSLPTGIMGPAVPSRFAMEIDGRLMEGEVVDLAKARRVYRDILHEARDPALLEQSQGNVFSARVFPIRPRAMVRLILSYTITVPLRSLRRTLALPLRGLPEIREFVFSAAVGSLGDAGFNVSCSLPVFGVLNGSRDNSTGRTLFAARSSGPFVPDADTVFEVQQNPGPTPAISVDGGGLVTLFAVENDTAAAGNGTGSAQFLPTDWVVYVDTSASTADSAVVRVPMIEALLDAMPTANVQVFAFDIEVEELWPRAPKNPALGTEVRRALEERLPLGATDLQKLMQHVDALVVPETGTLGVLVLSDAIPTAGERAAAQLGRLLADRPGRVVELAVIGSKFDSATGGAIAAAGGGRVVRIPLTSTGVPGVIATAWSDLTRPLGQRASLEVASGWVWPQAASDLHPGDEVVAFSGSGSNDLLLPAPGLQLGGRATSAPGTRAAGAAFGALLAREVAAARLELLEADRQLATNGTRAEELKREMVSISEQNRVMCQHTALLVLETEEDYVRFQIDRNQLASILVVNDSGVQLLRRTNVSLSSLPTSTAPPMTTTTSSGVNTTSNGTGDSQELTDEADNSLLPTDDNPGVARTAGDGETSDAPRSCPRPGFLSFLLGFICAIWGMQELPEFMPKLPSWGRVRTASTARRLQGGWLDLEATAGAVLQRYGDSGPQERRRDLAAEYAAALWTRRRAADLRNFTARWIQWDPANGLAYEYLSKAAQHAGDARTALRAATSIAEVAPRDPLQLLRGAWIALTADAAPGAAVWARRLAERSLQERDDNPNVHRALALACWRAGDLEAAARAYAGGLALSWHTRYGDVARVLREEAALLMRAAAAEGRDLAQLLPSVSSSEGRDIGLRVTLSWLTDANDVDLHVIDPNGEDCYYANRQTSWGLNLYSDQTRGLGPEVVALSGKRPGTYRVGVKYYSSGAMGAARGTVVTWHVQSGRPVGQAQIEVFTLPAGLRDVLPVTGITVQ